MSDVIFFVGTYNQRGGKGVYTVRADPHGAMRVVHDASVNNASFLAVSPNGRFLYAVNEAGEFNGAPGGGVTALAITDDTGALAPLNAVNVRGNGPCHVSVHPGGAWLVVSCYGDGTHTVVRVRDDGGLDAPPTDYAFNTGELGPGQKSKHAHSATFTPDGKFVYTCDLGLDRVSVYAFDDKRGQLKAVSSVAQPSGAGPRHFSLHPKLSAAYAINELNSTITVFRRDAKTGALTPAQTISTLTDAQAAAFKDGKLTNSCADIHLSRDGEFLYGSNRGADSIAVFHVEKDATLKPIGEASSGGKTPRNFALLSTVSPSADWLFAANQNSDNVVGFHRDRNGTLVRTGEALALPTPVCVLPWSGKKS